VLYDAAVRAEDLQASQDVATLEGQKLHITKVGAVVTVQNAKVIEANVFATNGIVHVIDGVLTPPATKAPTAAPIPTPAPTPVATKNLLELASSISDLSTLVTALKAGNITDEFTTPGPLTVFAPTNEAFAALPAATLASLLDPKNIKELDSILAYHVLYDAAVRAEDLQASQDVATLEGQKLHITKVGAVVTVQNAKVIEANVFATNGIVHVIDGVLTPPATKAPTAAPIPTPAPTPVATKNIVQLAAGVPALSTLVTALKAGKLVTALSGTGPFTVFAPTNDAFAALPKAKLASLLEPANIKDLDSILEYHVIKGSAVYSEDLKASQDVKTLEGNRLHITDVDGSVTLQNASVIKANVLATNGVVHVIDGVLSLPTAPDAPDDSSSSSSHTVIIVVGIIAAVILVGGGAFFWYKKSQKMEAAQQEDKEPLHQPHDDVEDPIARRN